MSATDRTALPLAQGWSCAVLPAGAAVDPAQLAGAAAQWWPATVPGTAAEALRDAGAVVPDDLDGRDCWFRCPLPPGGGALRFDGLATLAEVWLDDAPLLRSDNMFHAHEVPLPHGRGGTLLLRCRALQAPVGLPRARWRSSLAEPGWLRGVRTTLLGRMPGWFPGPPPVGPWRGVTLLRRADGGDWPGSFRARLSAVLDAGGARRARLRLLPPPGAVGPGATAWFEVGGHRAAMRWHGDAALTAELELPDAALWWPHTHGEPALHAASATVDGVRFDLGRTGFRRIEVDRGDDGGGFGLRVNGVPVFCRGAAWTTADPASPGGERRDPLPWLRLARDAGLNMLRLGGTMAYESDALHALCDGLGLMVWQDFAFASFDYPVADPAFRASVRREADALLDRLEASPSLAVLCGGSEGLQRPAMLGLPPATWRHALYDEVLADAAAEWRPDLPYLPNAPCAPPGAPETEPPHRAAAGVTHYYGVGAYRRPLGDARAAGVRFAAECLAFSNVPDAAATEALGAAPGHHPDWKRGVPRDPGASWDFEDVRDHYLEALFSADPARLRQEDPARYLDLSRATTAEVMAATLSEWRRPGSPCAGALVWQFQDVADGAGWGMMDRSGRPKSAWHGMRRACGPVSLLLLDEGVNGVAVHALNETARPVAARLEVVLWRGGAAVLRASREVSLPPRGSLSWTGEALFGRAVDLAWTWRFGPPSHEVVLATLLDPAAAADAPPLAEAALFPGGHGLPRRDLGLSARAGRDGDGWFLVVAAAAFAEGVHVEDENGFFGGDDWFHLAPGRPRRVPLRVASGAGRLASGAGQLASGAGRPPRGRVAALNGWNTVGYAAQEVPA